jgi:hypothetical protein
VHRDDDASREGGVKIVFDVPDDRVAQTIQIFGDSGFEVRRYYAVDVPSHLGGAGNGYTRLGAERPRASFTTKEQDAVLAEFETVRARHQLSATIVGVDTWEAEDGDDPAR